MSLEEGQSAQFYLQQHKSHVIQKTKQNNINDLNKPRYKKVNLNLIKMKTEQYFYTDSQVGCKIPRNELMQEDLLFPFLICEVTPPPAQFLLC